MVHNPNSALQRMIANWVDPNDIPRLADGSEIALKPFLNLLGPVLEGIGDWALAEINATRNRAIKTNERDAFKRVAGMLIANAIVATDKGTRTHYPRSNHSYSHDSVYCPPWLTSKLLISVVDALVKGGWLLTRDARKGGGGARSVYKATPKLLAYLHEQGINRENVELDINNVPVVRLEKADGQLANYNPQSSEMATKIGVLRRYNESTRNADIKLTFPSYVNNPVDLEKSKGSTHAYRIFKNQSLNQYGRIHGPWWQDIQSENREFINIDGMPTVELDFKGCGPRSLHHLNGHAFEADPYEVPEIKAASDRLGVDWKKTRNKVKGLMRAMLNTPEDQMTIYKYNFIKGMSYNSAIEYVLRYHHNIRHHFYQCEYHMVMNIDAEVCNSIIESALQNNIVILTIHDSFIVQSQHREWLERTMIEKYHSSLNFYPVIH